MIGFLAGKLLTSDESTLIVDVQGVGYSVVVPARLATGLTAGTDLRLHIHTNLRENALELFGFESAWEKRVFLALTTVSGVGPRTALSVLSALDPELLLSSIVREDRGTLNSVSGIGKKTAERLIVELGDKARKLLSERGSSGMSAKGAAPAAAAQASAPETTKTKRAASGATTAGKPGVAGEAGAQSSVDIADLWNEALSALVNLGYREVDAIMAIKQASNRSTEAGETVTLEKLVRGSLQLMSRGAGV